MSSVDSKVIAVPEKKIMIICMWASFYFDLSGQCITYTITNTELSHSSSFQLYEMLEVVLLGWLIDFYKECSDNLMNVKGAKSTSSP